MKFFSTASAVATATAALFVATSSVQAETEPWSYRSDLPDVYGPALWGVKYPTCAGQRQSPIDICVPGHVRRAAPLSFAGSCPRFNVKQFYDAYKAEAVNSTCTVTANGKTYPFAQVHFHAPSEHKINGKAHDGEVHFVHKSTDGILVVGLFLEKKAHAVTDPFFAKFWRQLRAVNTTNPASATLGSFVQAITSSASHGRVFNYPGGLTVPTCDETVDWWVVETPLSVAPADFDEIHTELRRIEAANDGRNARPTQPLHGRTITVY